VAVALLLQAALIHDLWLQVPFAHLSQERHDGWFRRVVGRVVK
jgi:hypothetical protein